MVKQVFLPVEKVYKVANGTKVVRERNYYPGYVMIEIADGKLSDDLRDTIKNTNSVIHFLGKDNPIALRKAEVNKMLGKMDEMAETGGVSMSEPFIRAKPSRSSKAPSTTSMVIEEVNDEKKKLKVTVKSSDGQRRLNSTICRLRRSANGQTSYIFQIPLFRRDFYCC